MKNTTMANMSLKRVVEWFVGVDAVPARQRGATPLVAPASRRDGPRCTNAIGDRTWATDERRRVLPH